jgi:hypothetical protein
VSLVQYILDNLNIHLSFGKFYTKAGYFLDELRQDMACAIAQQYVKKEVFDEHTKQYGSVAEGHWG